MRRIQATESLRMTKSQITVILINEILEFLGYLCIRFVQKAGMDFMRSTNKLLSIDDIEWMQNVFLKGIINLRYNSVPMSVDTNK